jgi:hypothetical protein
MEHALPGLIKAIFGQRFPLYSKKENAGVKYAGPE